MGNGDYKETVIPSAARNPDASRDEIPRSLHFLGMTALFLFPVPGLLGFRHLRFNR
jgi:hypothetical protein